MSRTSLHLLKMSNIVQPRGIFVGLQRRLNIAFKEKKSSCDLGRNQQCLHCCEIVAERFLLGPSINLSKVLS